MLENSLKIRGKFINKLVDKLEDLNNDLILLGKLDKKIYKKNNSQKGGNTANLVQLQLATYAKEQELKEEKDKLVKAIEATGNIGKQIDTMNAILKGITNQIDKFQIITPQLENMNVDLKYLEKNELDDELPKIIKKRTSWDDYSKAAATKDLANKIGQEMYNKLIKVPETNDDSEYTDVTDSTPAAIPTAPRPAAASATATPARPAATPARPAPAATPAAIPGAPGVRPATAATPAQLARSPSRRN